MSIICSIQKRNLLFKYYIYEHSVQDIYIMNDIVITLL